MGQAERQLLILAGPSATTSRSALTAAGREAGFAGRFVVSAIEASALMVKNPPAAVLLEASAPGAERVCHTARTLEQGPNTPVIAFEKKLSDRAFVKAFRCGADDLITLESTAELVKRLRNLPDVELSGPPSVRGEAVVAEPDDARRSAMTRVLRNAGYVVLQAKDPTAFDLALSEKCRVFVASTALGDPIEAVEAARERGNDASWVVMARTSEVESVAEKIRDLERVAVVDLGDPPENVLFVSNELSSPHGTEARREPRFLYGGLVAFRPAGGAKDDYGFTYNVSGHGLYVRTLAPPPDEDLWFEIRIPESSRRARFEGRVSWRTEFGPNVRATAPPGWGVEITSMLAKDEAGWSEGIAQLARQSAARSLKPPPKEPQGLAAAFGRGDVNPAKPPSPAPVAAMPVREIDEPVAHSEPVPPAGTDTSSLLPGEPQAASAVVSLPAAAAEPVAGPVAAPPAWPAAPPSSAQARKGAGAAALLVAVLGAVLVLALVGGAAFWFISRSTAAEHAPTAPGAPAPVPVASAAPVAPAPAEAARADAAPAAPAGSSTAAPSADELPPVVGIDEGGDGSDLKWSEGYLIVRSRASADVYAHAVRYGQTNKKLVVKCGLRWVRLGESGSVGPKWISAGHTVDVLCQKTTTVTIEASGR